MEFINGEREIKGKTLSRCVELPAMSKENRCGCEALSHVSIFTDIFASGKVKFDFDQF